MKIDNLLVRVEENNRIYEMPLRAAAKLPVKDLNGFFIYNFLMFTYPNDKPDYLKTGFRKLCIDSWHIAFPRMRIIYVDVSKCLGLSPFTDFYFERKSYPTDPLRILFLSRLNRAIYCDTDVYLRSDARDHLPLECKCFVGAWGCSGTFLYNKKRNNKKFIKWFKVYNKIPLDAKEYKCTDAIVYCRNKKALKIPEVNTTNICNHFSNIWIYIRDEIPFFLSDKENREINNRVSFSKECYTAFIYYLKNKGWYDKYVKEDAKDYIRFV